MEKRKRAPGGGRKPGEFGKLEVVMSLRLTKKLRDKLKRAADQSGRPINAEAFSRLNASFSDTYQLVRKLTSLSKEINFILNEAHGLLKPKGKK